MKKCYLHCPASSADLAYAVLIGESSEQADDTVTTVPTIRTVYTDFFDSDGLPTAPPSMSRTQH